MTFRSDSRKRCHVLVVAAIIALLYGAASNADFEDAVEQQKHYCEMVEAGAWPAYNPDINCTRGVK